MTTDVLTIGEALIALRPDGPVSTSGTVRLSVAGAETNVAIALARLGHASSWLGAVGADRLGQLVMRTLRAEGVDVSPARVGDGPNGIVLFEQTLPGVTSVDYFRHGSAGSTIRADDVRAAMSRMQPRMLHVSGVTLALSGAALSAAYEALSTGRRSGATTSFDVNHRARLWTAEVARAALVPFREHVDVLFASEDELALIAPDPARNEAEQAAACLDLGMSRVVVKRGARGATEYTSSGAVSGAAPRMPDVDPVGAGDAFAAGYLSAMLDGEADVLARACTLGAFAAATRGDWEGLPTRAELDQVHMRSGATLR